MKDAVIRQLGAMDRRVVLALGSLLLVFLALESWLLVLRGPVAEWRALGERQAVVAAGEAPAALHAEIARLRTTLETTERALAGSGLPKSDDAMVLHLIATLDQLARQNTVSLGPIRLGGRRPDAGLQAVTFVGEARGDYLSLLAWLAEAEAAIAPLRATDLSLNAGAEGRQVALRVTFTAYLPPTPSSPGASR